MIPGPFYRGIPSLTVVYRGKPLSFPLGYTFTDTYGLLNEYTAPLVLTGESCSRDHGVEYQWHSGRML